MKINKLFLLIMVILPLCSYAQQKNSPEKINASKIITMSNSVIDLSNRAIEDLEGYQSVVSTAEGNIKRLTNNPNVQVYFVNYKVYTPDQVKIKQFKTASQQAPAFGEKNDIINTVEKANQNSDEVIKQFEKLSAYFSNKEYLSDPQFSKYPDLLNNAVSALYAAYDSWKEASRLASKAGDNAELVILKDSKIADFVIPMKTDLNGLNDIFSQILKKDANIPTLQNDVKGLKASIDKNKDVSTKDVKKLSDIYYKEVYVTFYRKCAQTSDMLDKLLGLLSQPESEIDKDQISRLFNQAGNSYSDAVKEYNKFVSQ